MRRDDRTFITVHDGMPDHPKIEVLSDKAFRLLITAWCWCSRYKTDGFMPEASWRQRATPKVRKELQNDLVHEAGHDCPECPEVPKGYVLMHDYLKHQRSSQEIDEARRGKSEGGQRGNHVRWHVERGVFSEDCEFCLASLDRSHMRSGSDQTSDGGSDAGEGLNEVTSEQYKAQNNRRNPEKSEPPREPQNPPTSENTVTPPIAHGSHTDRKSSPSTSTDKESGYVSRERYVGRRETAKERAAALSAAGHSPTAHRLVNEYADSCVKRPPSSTLTKLAVEVDKLLVENWTPEQIAPALAELGAKGLGPSLLPDIAHEITNRAPRKPRASQTNSTDANIAALMGGATQLTHVPAAPALPRGELA